MTVSANVSSILQQIAALNVDEVAELRAQLESQAATGSNSASQPQLQSDPQDEAAFKWINEHGHEYPDQWLALDGDRLLAHGSDLAEVAAAARAAGVGFPLLHLVEPVREHPYIRS